MKIKNTGIFTIVFKAADTATPFFNYFVEFHLFSTDLILPFVFLIPIWVIFQPLACASEFLFFVFSGIIPHICPSFLLVLFTVCGCLRSPFRAFTISFLNFLFRQAHIYQNILLNTRGDPALLISVMQ